MEALLRNTDSTSIKTTLAESGPTYFSPQGTARTLDHCVGPVGIHQIVEKCRVLWSTGRRLQLIPAGLPRDHMPILLTLRYTLQPQRGEIATPQLEGKWDHQAIADCLQKGDKRVEFLKAVDSSFEKARPKFEALREDPTPDAHWALWNECMRELARTFFSLNRTSKKDDVKRRLSALRRKLVSEQATRREQMGKFWETYGHLGDYSEQHLHARHRLSNLSWQLRRWSRQAAAARRSSLETELHKALRKGRSHEVHRLTQLLGGKGVGVRKRLFFHLPGSRPDKEEMKTHVTKLGASVGIGCRSGRHWGNGAKIQGGSAASRTTGHEYGDKGKKDPLLHSKRAGEGEPAQGSATLECTRGALSYVRIAIVSVGGTETTRRHRGRRNHERSKEVHTCKDGIGIYPGTRATSTTHTMQRALLQRTLNDKRNGQKGMLDTRIIHVLCPWWKSLFAAMVRETVSEGGDEHFSPIWHGFLRGRRREGAMLAQRCMGWRLTSLGKSHLNSLTDMSNAFSCT